MKCKVFFLSVFLIVMLAVGLAYSLSAFLSVTNVGVVKAVGISIYEDSDCIIPLTQIDWGIVEPDSTVTYDAWLCNEGNVPVRVSLYTENWIPLNASDFMDLTWDSETVIIDVDETISCLFSLQIYENVSITDFSFNIVLVGSGV